MTPKMIRALSDAEAAAAYRGLERTVAGWRSTRPGTSLVDHHSFSSVNALLDQGYLQLWGTGKAAVAHITSGGELWLATWRERVRK